MDADWCCPPEVYRWTAVEDQAAQQLKAAEQALTLRKSLRTIAPDVYVPAADLEAAAHDAKRTIDAAKAKAHQVLERACLFCPSPCPARMPP